MTARVGPVFRRGWSLFGLRLAEYPLFEVVAMRGDVVISLTVVSLS